MRLSSWHLFAWILLLSSAPLLAVDPPGILNHQGRISVDGTNHDGPGHFKFSLVKDAGLGTEAIIWHHDGTVTSSTLPATELVVPVVKGHYSVLLGETPAMSSIPASAFSENVNVSLRIWFGAVSGGPYQLLSPDRRITTVGYAMVAKVATVAQTAESIVDGAISTVKMADGSVTAAKLAIGLATPWVTVGQDISFTSGDVEISNLVLPPTTTTTGMIRLGNETLLHGFGTDNFFAGRGAGNLTLTGGMNTGLGVSSLAALTTGINNTAVGGESLITNTTGKNNTATGHLTLSQNTTGSNNSALGQGTLQSNVSGEFNTAIGAVSMRENISGDRNTAVGQGSLSENSDGSNNTAVGLASLLNNTSGSESTAMGKDALFANTTGSRNTALGAGSLRDLTGGNDNLAVGYDAGIDLQTGSQNLYLANRGVAAESATIRIGDGDQTRSFMAGIRGITTGQGDALPVVIDSNGQLGTGGGVVDTDPSNELQMLSLTGNQISLSQGGGIITLSDNNSTNELQTVALAGTTVTLSAGGGSFSINDADADPANEIQLLSLVGDTIHLSNGGGQLNLAGKISTTMLADGSVTSAKIGDGQITEGLLAPGSVTVEKVADQSITGAKLADGSIDGSKLSKNPRAGLFDSAQLPFSTERIPFSVTFPTPFSSAPIVTATPALTSHPGAFSASISTATATGFSGLLSGSADASRLIYGRTGLTLHSFSMREIAGRLSIVFSEEDSSNNFTIKYSSSVDPYGFEWSQPITLPAGNYPTGSEMNLTEIQGFPALAYRLNPSALVYIRATNPEGSSWSTPVSVDPGTASEAKSLTVVNGNPAIAYHNTTQDDVKYVRANNAEGTSWGAPMTIVSTGNVGRYLKLLVVDGNPAIAYFDSTNNDLKFIRASDPNGTSWGSSVTVESTGLTGSYLSMEIVNGRPAISYRSASEDFSVGYLSFVRANNASGTSWGTKIRVVSSPGGQLAEGNSLQILDGVPTICFRHLSRLRLVRALDVDGTNWGEPVDLGVENVSDNGFQFVIASGKPVISHMRSKDLMFLPAFFEGPIHWIAIEP
jgi:hypothetical protein